MGAGRLSNFASRLRAIRQASPFSLDKTLADAVAAKIAGAIGGSGRPIAERHILPQVQQDIVRLDTVHAALWREWARFERVREAGEGPIFDHQRARRGAGFALGRMLALPILALIVPSMVTGESSDSTVTFSVIVAIVSLFVTFWMWVRARKRSRRADAQRRVERSLGADAEAALIHFEKLWEDSADQMHAFAAKVGELIDEAATLRPVRKAIARDRVADAEARLVSARYQASLAQKSLADAQAKHIRASGAEERGQAQRRFKQAAYWNVSKEQDVAMCESKLRMAIVDYESI